ncbi:undecaprenyl/decaprenyl-phosphate alpha-N-acetylglucosaminyl 1-phosphate transferase [Oceanospirillaceae bacterium]|nr:undecaprenyl/decaprenyl-phosphate alpha-N-acetylglucosaminyl 1-phosphate transferase [Oceanospirillaceae bacterium]
MAITAELWQANLLALVSAFVAIKVLRPIAIYFNLVDIPTDRKQHVGHIPLIGGLSIYVGVLVAILAVYPLHDKLFFLLVSASLILVAGLVDDLKQLAVWVRILIQSIACIIMIKGTGVYVESLGDLFGMGEIYLGQWGIPFTIFAVIGLVNAINMSDGIDGLIGSLALVVIGGVFLFESISGNYHFFDLLLVMVAALVPYLLTNLSIISQRKIFLGDAGSMFIGFTLAWVLIELSQGAGNSKAIEPVNVLWCVALPVIDTLVVIIKRLRVGNSPFRPDRGHFHHMLQDLGLGPQQTLLAMTMMALLLVALGGLMQLLWPEASATVFILVMVGYLYWVKRRGWGAFAQDLKLKDSKQADAP